MRDDDGHTRHYPDDNPCNSCAYATCRDRPHNFFRECSRWREWFMDLWQGYQIAAAKIKTSR